MLRTSLHRFIGVRFIVGVLLFLFCTMETDAQETKITARKRPNIIVIYSDDQGSFDLNCYGSKDIQTPHLDHLAKHGIRFTRMYSPSAICSASRAGLMTGRYPVRAGVPGNVSSKKGVAGMPTAEVTLAEHLKANGYATGHVGKWHLGYTPDTMPNGQGFDSSFGHMGGCIDNYSHFFYWNGPNRHDLWRNGTEVFHDGEYFGDLMVDECCDFIKQEKENPFFLYWAINWPHYPMQGTGKWRKIYKDLPHPRDKYAIFVSSMDELVGRVVKQLDDLKLREDTIIVFQSDHGHSVEERAFFGGGNPGPFRGAKGCLFEGGIRVPSIVSWPGSLPQDETREQLAIGLDWVPTLLELSKSTQRAKSPELDGLSLAGVLQHNEPSPHPYLYWQLGRGPNAQWALQRDNLKLMANPRDVRDPKSIPPGTKHLMFDLKADQGEKTDLRQSNKESFESMMKLRSSIAESLQMAK